jgi:hypothetical protein
MSLAWQVAPPEVRSELLAVFNELHLFDFNSSYYMALLLKEMSNVFKKFGDLLSQDHWKWFINWENLGGYLPKLDIKDFVGDLEDWATGDIVHEMPGKDGVMSETVFLDCLEEGMWQFLEQAPNVSRANENALSLDSYVLSPGNWATPGATQIKESVSYEVRKQQEDGSPDVLKTYKPRGSKWRSALALPPERIKQLMLDDSITGLTQNNSAVQKQELGKVRAVVSADDVSYLRMDYISTWLETALNGHPLSTLYMNTTQVVHMWERLSRSTAQNEFVKIPLDQSHFDWQQNKRMLARFCAVVKKFIEVNATATVRDELLLILSLVKRSLVDFTGIINVGTGSEQRRIPIEKGVMSGWRWTALMDTVFNWGELHCARRLVVEWGMGEPVIEAVAQGDDDQVLCKTYGHAAALVEAYSVMNFEVNPGKFFVDIRRDEFLRQVIQPGVVSGYPVRGISSLLWRNPISRDPPAGLLRLNEQLKGWNLLVGRGADEKSVYKLMLLDMTQGNGLSKHEVIGLLETPATVGGLGYWQSGSTDWYSVSPGKVDYRAKLVKETVRGMNNELEVWNKIGPAFDEKDAIQSLADNLELAKAPVDVTKGSVEEVPYLRPRLWVVVPSLGAVPTAARSKKDLPTTLNGFMLDTAIANRDWQWVREVWLDPSLRDVSDRIESNGGRRVWVDWLRGKLPIKLPTIPSWSDLKPSILFAELINHVWARVYSKSSFNMTVITRAFVTAELAIRDWLQTSEVRLGG